MTQAPEVTITAGEYYLARSLRSVRNVRDYTAVVNGVEIRNTSLATIKTVIRQHIHRATGSNRVRFVLVEPPDTSKVPVTR